MLGHLIWFHKPLQKRSLTTGPGVIHGTVRCVSNIIKKKVEDKKNFTFPFKKTNVKIYHISTKFVKLNCKTKIVVTYKDNILNLQIYLL